MTPDQRRARNAVYRALTSGELIRPDTCQQCGEKHSSKNITAHHHNGYDPEHEIDVEWLCRRCHGAKHGGVLNIPAEVHRTNLTTRNAAMSAEERTARARHAALSPSPEQRVVNARRARAKSPSWYGVMSAEERSAKMRDQITREKTVTCSCGKIGRGCAIANHRRATGHQLANETA